LALIRCAKSFGLEKTFLVIPTLPLVPLPLKKHTLPTIKITTTTMAEVTHPSGIVIEIVGIEKGDCGCSCEEHDVCGVVVKDEEGNDVIGRIGNVWF
jgi:hypothetical protein